MNGGEKNQKGYLAGLAEKGNPSPSDLLASCNLFRGIPQHIGLKPNGHLGWVEGEENGAGGNAAKTAQNPFLRTKTSPGATVLFFRLPPFPKGPVRSTEAAFPSLGRQGKFHGSPGPPLPSLWYDTMRIPSGRPNFSGFSLRNLRLPPVGS